MTGTEGIVERALALLRQGDAAGARKAWEESGPTHTTDSSGNLVELLLTCARNGEWDAGVTALGWMFEPVLERSLLTGVWGGYREDPEVVFPLEALARVRRAQGDEAAARELEAEVEKLNAAAEAENLDDDPDGLDF